MLQQAHGRTVKPEKASKKPQIRPFLAKNP